ncbi:hypothetical protein [uncultured Agrococcus sp.]|uniref:hypothetical protein n=1 Tax=uncultured Agrococcus sp. TaxID=382258 RepID=UPI0025E689FD|nr:hypothetical protein [uncultured Agrococcus sp.]
MFAIEWATEDPSVFLREGIVYASRGSGAEKEVVALDPDIDESLVPEQPLDPLDFTELWSVEVGESMFSVSDHLFFDPVVAVIRAEEALLLDAATGEQIASFALPGEATGIALETFDSFFIDFADGETEQLVLTSEGELLSLAEWVDDFPDDVSDYGALHDWVLPIGEERKSALHIRGDELYWRFDGAAPAFADELGLGDDYVLGFGVQGYSSVFLQYSRTGTELESGNYTSEDVAVAQVDDGELIDVHHGAVICGTGICSGEFEVEGGIVAPGASAALLYPDDADAATLELPDVREFPFQLSGSLPGGEYEAVALGENWTWLEDSSPTHITHSVDDPLRVGEDVVVPCQRVDDVAGAAACSGSGTPVVDEDVPSRVVERTGADETLGHFRLFALVTDQHILIAPVMMIE